MLKLKVKAFYHSDLLSTVVVWAFFAGLFVHTTFMLASRSANSKNQ